jgi:hypothetical protein
MREDRSWGAPLISSAWGRDLFGSAPSLNSEIQLGPKREKQIGNLIHATPACSAQAHHLPHLSRRRIEARCHDIERHSHFLFDEGIRDALHDSRSRPQSMREQDVGVNSIFPDAWARVGGAISVEREHRLLHRRNMAAVPFQGILISFEHDSRLHFLHLGHVAISDGQRIANHRNTDINPHRNAKASKYSSELF